MKMGVTRQIGEGVGKADWGRGGTRQKGDGVGKADWGMEHERKLK